MGAGVNVMVWGFLDPIRLIENTDRFVCKGLWKVIMLAYDAQNMPIIWNFQQNIDQKHMP